MVWSSNLGLINDLYNCNINFLLLHKKVCLITPNTALALPVLVGLRIQSTGARTVDTA